MEMHLQRDAFQGSRYESRDRFIMESVCMSFERQSRLPQGEASLQEKHYSTPRLENNSFFSFKNQQLIIWSITPVRIKLQMNHVL